MASPRATRKRILSYALRFPETRNLASRLDDKPVA